MRLGEALTLRADVQKRIAQIGARLQASAVVQEGDSPPEDPSRLLAELDELTAELERLITAINLTNASGRLPSGQSVTAALARRDVLRSARASCARRSTPSRRRRPATRARRSASRGRSTWPRWLELDELARERRELDTAIQEHNWTADLIEDASR